jgi:hypothetical protein
MSLRLWFLDFLGVVFAVQRYFVDAFSSVFTVQWDPRGYANRVIPMRCNGFTGFQVVSAPSEFERRVIAWLYRSSDTPNEEVWIACLKRFGIKKVPEHFLTLWVGSTPVSEMIHVVSINIIPPIVAGGESPSISRHIQTVDDEARTRVAKGAAPLGDVSVVRFVKDLRLAHGEPALRHRGGEPNH